MIKNCDWCGYANRSWHSKINGNQKIWIPNAATLGISKFRRIQCSRNTCKFVAHRQLSQMVFFDSGRWEIDRVHSGDTRPLRLTLESKLRWAWPSISFQILAMEIGQLLLHLKEKRKVNEIKQKIVCTHRMKFGIILDYVSHTSRKHHSLMTNENFENPTMDECSNKLNTSIVNQNITNTSCCFF